MVGECIRVREGEGEEENDNEAGRLSAGSFTSSQVTIVFLVLIMWCVKRLLFSAPKQIYRCSVILS